jgi:hypothetical protein
MAAIGRAPTTAANLQSPYRFVFLLEKAQELATQVRELGAALLSAFEKGDAEYLSSLRAGHERELLNLTLSIRKDQWRDADWQRQALLKTKEVAQTNRRYYATLIQNGLNNGELQYLAQSGVSLSTHASANVIEGIAEAMNLIPDLFVGFPCNETWLPLGTKLAGLFNTHRAHHAFGRRHGGTDGRDRSHASGLGAPARGVDSSGGGPRHRDSRPRAPDSDPNGAATSHFRNSTTTSGRPSSRRTCRTSYATSSRTTNSIYLPRK